MKSIDRLAMDIAGKDILSSGETRASFWRRSHLAYIQAGFGDAEAIRMATRDSDQEFGENRTTFSGVTIAHITSVRVAI